MPLSQLFAQDRLREHGTHLLRRLRHFRHVRLAFGRRRRAPRRKFDTYAAAFLCYNVFARRDNDVIFYHFSLSDLIRLCNQDMLALRRKACVPDIFYILSSLCLLPARG